ncbi:MAG: His-Xaa-Ser system radical SAM maturase HxsB [Candidatus Woesearchaeota archaeon]
MRFIYGKDYENAKTFSKRYDDGVLLTNDVGNWCFLTHEEHKKYAFRELDEKLFYKLKEANMIMTDDSMDSYVHQFNDYYWYLSKGTSLHIMIPTLRCNFTCKYCYAYRVSEEAQGKDMTEDTVDKTVDFIFSTPSENYNIEFSGGEPLLRFDIVKRAILRAHRLAKEKGKQIHIAIITNGTLINDEIFDFFREYRVGICLSLDGPESLHNSNRKFTKGNRPTYDAVVDSINMLKKRGCPSLNALPVIVRDSLPRWKEVVDEYINHGFTVLSFKFVSRFGFASRSWDKMSYTSEEYLETWKKVIDYMIEQNKKGIQIVENMAAIIIHKFATGTNANYAEMTTPCGAVTGQIVYDYDGSIYTCDEARTMDEFRIGNVFSSTYKELLDHEATKALKSASDLSSYHCDSGCPWYSFCGICPLEIYTEEKGFITNMESNYRHKIHKGMFEFLMDKILHNPEEKKILYKWLDVRPGIVGSSELASENINIFAEYEDRAQEPVPDIKNDHE